MNADPQKKLLSARNTRIAWEIAKQLGPEQSLGAVVLGCRHSGRRAIVEQATRDLETDASARRVSIPMPSAPRTPLEFWRYLADRIGEVIDAGSPARARLLTARSYGDETHVYEQIRSVLMGLPPERRPVLLFFNIDCIWKSHAEVDGCFARLRGLLDATQTLCLVTATEEIPMSLSPGTSHFANNFMRRSPEPVTPDEIAEAWAAQGAPFLHKHDAARLVAERFGFAEGRVQLALQWLSLQADAPSDALAARLETYAIDTGTREAEVFWERLTQPCRDVLCASATEADNPPHAVQLLLSHEWSKYRLTMTGEARVAFHDAALRALAVRKLHERAPSIDAKDVGGRAPSSPTIVEPPVRYLHISDIHFQPDPAKAYDQEKVLKGLLSTLRKERPHAPLDLIFFTGDLAQAAKAEEYGLAVKFIRELLAATGVDPSRVFVVPGNHDVDRSVGRWLLRTMDSNDERAASFFLDRASRAAHLRKFEAYRTALAPVLGTSRPLGLEVGGDAVEVVDVRGVKIAVASFNSAWFAVADDDVEKLWLGEVNVDRAAQRIAGMDGISASIALMHHPTEYLHEAERASVENHIERHFDVVLRGHLHKDKAKSVQTPRGAYLELAAPAAHQGSRWPNGCLVGELQPTRRTVRLRPYKFGNGADPWTLDPSVFPDDEANGYCRTFPLRVR